MKDRVEKLLANTGDMALKRRAKMIIEGTDPKGGDRILDVGCGDGYYLYLLSNLGLKLNLAGADFDSNALASARKNLGRKNIKLYQADLMKKLPFKSNTFDKIVMSEVTEHLPDDVRGLKEVKRVLKRGGTLVLTVPNHNYPLLWDPVNWILEHFAGTHIESGFWSGLWNQHLRLYKPEEIENVVKKAGFKIEKIEATTWWCLPFNHNLLNFAAVTLHSGGFSKDVSRSINKFESASNRSLLIDFVFGLVNVFDGINDLYKPENVGVGVYVSAKKS